MATHANARSLVRRTLAEITNKYDRSRSSVVVVVVVVVDVDQRRRLYEVQRRIARSPDTCNDESREHSPAAKSVLSAAARIRCSDSPQVLSPAPPSAQLASRTSSERVIPRRIRCAATSQISDVYCRVWRIQSAEDVRAARSHTFHVDTGSDECGARRQQWLRPARQWPRYVLRRKYPVRPQAFAGDHTIAPASMQVTVDDFKWCPVASAPIPPCLLSVSLGLHSMRVAGVPM